MSSFCAKLKVVLSPPKKSTPNIFSPRAKMPKASDTTMNVHVSTNNGVASFMKLTLALLMMCIMGNDVKMFRSSMKLKINRVTTSDGEQAGRDADGQRHAEALDFAGAHANQDDGRNQRGDVRVKNRAERAGITGGNRAAQDLPLASSSRRRS